MLLIGDQAQQSELIRSPRGRLWAQDCGVRRLKAANDNGSYTNCLIRFQGQYFDAETGLHYNRHRYYNPEARNYLSPDPIGLAGGLRSFGYVDDPMQWIDPFGLTTCPKNVITDPGAAQSKLPNEVANPADIANITVDPNNPYQLNDVPLSSGSPSSGYQSMGVADVDLNSEINNLSSNQSATQYNNTSSPQLPQSNAPYTEYRINPTGTSGSNRQRLVVGNDGTIYYTPDHYNTFIEL